MELDVYYRGRNGTNPGFFGTNLTILKNTVVVVRHSNKILKVVVTDLKILK